MYTIKKVPNRITSINDPAWKTADVANITYVNWPDYPFTPNTTGKVLYDDFGLYVQLETDEKPLLARYTMQNQPVNTDSCMEFFFRPNENDERYLNYEFNAFGTMYFAIRSGRGDAVRPEIGKDFFEVQTDVNKDRWIIQFTVPFEYIDSVFGTHTKTIYGNFFKCGDETNTPHFLTYAPVDTPAPDFHHSEFFVKFELE